MGGPVRNPRLPVAPHPTYLVVHREETRRLACLGAEPRVLPAMTRHHRRSRTVRTVPYHHRFAPAAVTQGGSHVELCTSPLRSHGRANMGGFDGLVVVRRDFTAAAGQTQPVPSPTMSAGDVRWATRGLSLGYDAHRPPQCHNQPHLPDHRPFEPPHCPESARDCVIRVNRPHRRLVRSTRDTQQRGWLVIGREHRVARAWPRSLSECSAPKK